MRVLLVEDEPVLADVISTSLQAADMEVYWAANLAAARRALTSAPFDLLLLDLHLPDGDGRSILLESGRLPPVVVLSALGEEEDVVELLSLGARDYILKPFRTGELLARMRSAVRETGAPDPKTLPIEFDDAAQCVNVGRRRIQLSRLECRLLATLLKEADRPVTYERLIGAIWGDGGKDQVALRVLVAQLRQKIEPEVERPTIIRSDRGIGYRLSIRPLQPAAF
jgi:two-component system KDP operon response regulator KdpE